MNFLRYNFFLYTKLNAYNKVKINGRFQITKPTKKWQKKDANEQLEVESADSNGEGEEKTKQKIKSKFIFNRYV